MEHWGIYLAYGWLATIVLGVVDAVRAIRKGPQLQLAGVAPPKPRSVV